MPGPDVLKAMYGPEYEKSFDDEDSTQDPKDPSRIMELLEKTPKGVFLDYGCGGGDLLVEAGSRGWSVLGIEFDESRARATAERTKLKCVTRDDDSVGARRADVVHLGDVLEHLVDVETEMKRILRLLKPGGFLVAQGPLEANANLYTLTLKLKGFRVATLENRDGALSRAACHSGWAAGSIPPVRARRDRVPHARSLLAGTSRAETGALEKATTLGAVRTAKALTSAFEASSGLFRESILLRRTILGFRPASMSQCFSCNPWAAE